MKKNLDIWDYEEQTKIKHLVFSDYFDKWVKILGKYHSLNYIDGFAGFGEYKDEKGTICFGSPICAAEIIKNNKKDANITIIDINQNNLNHLKEIFESKCFKVKIEFVNLTFDDAINKIISSIPEGRRLAPTFIFVDPFGFKGVKYKTLEKIMNAGKIEILLNFMFNGINRFISLKQNEEIMNDLFGTEEWKGLLQFKDSEREDAIINLYRNQLKKISKFVFPYKIEFPEKKRTYYYLFHLSNHHKGASIMKSSFAKFNYGRIEYLGSRGNQLKLSEVGNIKIEEVKRFLADEYKNLKKKYGEIIEEKIDRVEFLESEIYNSLKELERENKIEIKRDPPLTDTGKKRESIYNNDTIIFK